MGQRRVRAVARRKARHGKRERDRSARRADFERILAVVGLGEWYRGLRGDAGDRLCDERNPALRVASDVANPPDPRLEVLAEALKSELDRVAIPVGDGRLSFGDYHAVVMRLLTIFRTFATDRRLRASLRGPASTLEEFVRRHDDPIWAAFESKVLASLSEAGSIDTAIYSARLEDILIGDRTGLNLVLKRTPVPSRAIEVGGVRRKAYRCGDFSDLDSGEVDWVEWDAGALGLASSSRLPVYIQSHAIRQVHARLGISPRHFVDYSLRQSLYEAIPTPAPGGGYLVEYRLAKLKLGYLVAEVAGDAVLVRTFLLVTMRGTPEGSEFARRLRLGRPDIEHLELDRLGTLVATDQARDPEIAGLLRDCGCGDALDLAPRVEAARILDGYADRFRRYTSTALPGGCSRHLAER